MTEAQIRTLVQDTGSDTQNINQIREALIGIVNSTSSTGNTSYVDPQLGDDATAVVGDKEYPFATVMAANVASNIVVLGIGTYSETIIVPASSIFYEMPGVIHTAGRWSSQSSTAEIKIFGHGVYAGTSYGLELTGGANAYWEFDSAKNIRRVLWVSGSSKAVVRANYVTCNAYNNIGAACTVRDGGNVDMNIREYFHSQHTLLFIRPGTSNPSGKIKFTCPDAQIVENYTINYGNSNKSVVYIQNGVGFDLELNGKFSITDPQSHVYLTGVLSIIQSETPLNTVKIKGIFDGGLRPAVVTQHMSAVSVLDIKAEGEFLSTDTAIRLVGSPSAPSLTSMSLMGSSVIATKKALDLNGRVDMKILNSSMYSSNTNNEIILVDADVTLGVNNSVAQGFAGTKLVNGVVDVHFHNFASNVALGTSTDVQSGIVVIPTLKTINR